MKPETRTGPPAEHRMKFNVWKLGDIPLKGWYVMYVMETKVCRACSVIKFIDQYEKDGSYENKNGIVKTKYKLDCKECRKGCRTEYLKSYGQTHREELNQKKQERRHRMKNCVNNQTGPQAGTTDWNQVKILLFDNNNIDNWVNHLII